MAIDIISACRDPRLIADLELSPAQEVILRAINGLALPECEIETRFFRDGQFVREMERPLDMFLRCTGRASYVPREYSEVVMVCGRRSGKTEKVLGNQLIFEANFRERPDRPGDEPEAMIISRTTRQARKAFKYASAKQKGTAALRARIAGEFRKEDYDLVDNAVVSVWPCNSENVRSAGAFFVGCDEVCFWKNRESNANPAREVLRALRPSLAMYEHAKLILISTPFAKVDGDPCWDAMKSRAERQDVLVWQQPSWEINPRITDEFLLAEFRRDPESFFREYGAQFWESASNFLPSDSIDACVVAGRLELGPQPGVRYTAALDCAFRADNFAFGIVHNAGGNIVQDLLRVWHGSRSKPVDLASTLAEITDALRRYGIFVIHGDNFASEPIKQAFAAKGITYQMSHTLGNSAIPIWSTLRTLVSSRQFELLDVLEQSAELKSLQLIATGGGQRVEASHGTHDDRAVVLALASHMAIASGTQREPWVEVWQPRGTPGGWPDEGSPRMWRKV